jgi:uncharacterized protein (TIGR02246 family)
MKTLMGCVVALAILAGLPLLAQQKDADLDRLVQEYTSAWNKGDAKALAALYADDAMRTGEQPGEVVAGKQAIEQFHMKNLAGPGKGTKITINPGRTQSITPDVRSQEGTWSLSGGKEGPQRGHYLNTVVRQGGTWRIAVIASTPEATPAK